MRPVIAAVCLLVCLAATEEGGNDSDDENAPPTVPGADIWAATPPPPPPGPTSAQQDFALASSTKTALAEANATSLTPHSEYRNSPSLARSMDTTPWKNRDRKQVTRSKTLLDDDAQLHEGNQTFTMAGSISEKELVLHMTRFGLFRRSDSKFAEFVSQPTGTGFDGYGLWRTWESQGSCPEELLVADPWGSLSWEAAPGSLRTINALGGSTWHVPTRGYQAVARANFTDLSHIFACRTARDARHLRRRRARCCSARSLHGPAASR